MREMPRQVTLIGETEIISDLGDAAALPNPAFCFLESQAHKIAIGASPVAALNWRINS